ncbi:MAG: hypothetical protein ACR2G7_01455 [Acidimicrobiales bacterium]
MTDIVVYDQNEGVDVYGQCDEIERWAAACDSVPELQDGGHQLAAIQTYLERTSTAGRARVAAAMRRLEARIGDLLGPAEVGRPATGKVPREEPSIPANRRADFRRMAEHPEVVEDEIVKSTDEAPASRRKVMEAIKKTKAAKPEKRRRTPLPDFAQKAGWEYRKSVERLERVFEDDRFAANKEQVARHVRGHLAYGIEVCPDLAHQLSEEP